MSSTGKFNPIPESSVLAESTKKLKYLKNPKMIISKMIAVTSHTLRALFRSERSMLTATHWLNNVNSSRSTAKR